MSLEVFLISEFVYDCIISSLSIWLNSPVYPSGAGIFFVGRLIRVLNLFTCYRSDMGWTVSLPPPKKENMLKS